MAGRLAPLANVEKLSPLVTRLLGQNPRKMTLQGTNTYLVGRGPELVLIDTGDANIPSYIDLLSDTLQQHNLSVSSVVITHHHGDHMGGCPSVLDLIQKEVPVYKYPHTADKDVSTKFTRVSEGQVITVPGASLRVHHTPGHSSDSISLYLQEEGSLFCGDSILGGSSGSYDDYYLYMQTLEMYKSLAPHTIYTGHGVTEKLDIVDKYIAHRRQREDMVLSVLRSQSDAISIPDLTLEVYRDDGISDKPTLLYVANRIVELYLNKFVIDKTAEEVSPGLWKSC